MSPPELEQLLASYPETLREKRAVEKTTSSGKRGRKPQSNVIQTSIEFNED